MNKLLQRPLNRTVLKNFLRLSAIFLVIIITISLFMYTNSKQILTRELESNNYLITSNYATQLDDYFNIMKRLSVVLSLNEMVNFYVTTPQNAVEIFDGLYNRIQTQLQLATYSFDYIDSIYVVSLKDHSYITKNGCYPLQQMTDVSWLSAISSRTHSTKPQILARMIDGIYPFVLSIITQIGTGQDAGYVVVNLDIKKLPALVASNDTEGISTYIVTDDSRVLYRSMKRELYADIALFPELSAFDADADVNSVIVEDTQQPYAYTQIRSKDYDWHYVTITYLQQYTNSLSVQRALLATFSCGLLVLLIVLAFILCLNAYKPIRKLLHVIDDPQGWMTAPEYTTEEVKQIAEQFIRYVQTNTELSNELQKQLHTLSDVHLWALQSQINPHFIFNTLNHIHFMCAQQMGYQNEVSSLVLTFSKVIRYALYSDNLVSLSREIACTELFLTILQRRYGASFSCEVAVPEDCMPAMIPKLILQPLIENALHHGADFERKKTIHVAVRALRQAVDCDDGSSVASIVLTVQDDGMGMLPEKLHALRQSLTDEPAATDTSIGLRNVATRLHLLFPEHSQLTIESAPGEGTEVPLRFPYYELPPAQSALTADER